MSIFQALIAESGDIHVPIQLEINHQIGIVIWGQSNALGFTTPDVPSTSPINYQLPIRGVSMYINSTGNFNTLLYAVNALGNTFNSDLSMGYALHDAIGRPVYMGMEAVNGSPLWNDTGHTNFSPDAIGGLRLIDDLLAVFDAVRDKCALYGKTPYIISVFIGTEADAQDDTNADEVRDNYEATIGYLLSNGAQIDSHIISILNEDYANGTPSQIATVRARMTAYCNENANAYPLEMNNYPMQADDVHFTGPGQQSIGEDVASIILDEIFGLGIEVYPGSYSTDAKNALKNYRDDIPTGYKDAIADFVDGCQTDGNLDNIVVMQIRAMDTQQSAMVDIRGKKYATGNGGTHDPGGGITYDGVDDYTDTNFQPDSDGGTQWTQNNAGIGWYVVDNLDTGTGYLGGCEGNSSRFCYLLQISGSQLAYAINSGGVAGSYTGETAFADGNLYLARRTAASGAGATGLIKGSTVLDEDNIASNGLGNRKIFEAAKNNVGTPNNWNNQKLAFFVAFDPTSFDYAAFKTRVDTLIADLAAL